MCVCNYWLWTDAERWKSETKTKSFEIRNYCVRWQMVEVCLSNDEEVFVEDIVNTDVLRICSRRRWPIDTCHSVGRIMSSRSFVQRRVTGRVVVWNVTRHLKIRESLMLRVISEIRFRYQDQWQVEKRRDWEHVKRWDGLDRDVAQRDFREECARLIWWISRWRQSFINGEDVLKSIYLETCSRTTTARRCRGRTGEWSRQWSYWIKDEGDGECYDTIDRTARRLNIRQMTRLEVYDLSSRMSWRSLCKVFVMSGQRRQQDAGRGQENGHWTAHTIELYDAGIRSIQHDGSTSDMWRDWNRSGDGSLQYHKWRRRNSEKTKTIDQFMNNSFSASPWNWMNTTIEEWWLNQHWSAVKGIPDGRIRRVAGETSVFQRSSLSSGDVTVVRAWSTWDVKTSRRSMSDESTRNVRRRTRTDRDPVFERREDDMKSTLDGSGISAPVET